ncbi:MAG TPA: tetratricopeptide repeat protein [Planctomycetaceae bacterium]|nr:tetratricopeptide repeat protein [Planctomycetaceae bacterium]
MLHRIPTWALALAVLAAAQSLLLAQGRQPGRRPAAQPNVNSRHEEFKTQADQAYQRGEYDQTLQLTERVLRENARDHVALYLRGSARIELGFSRGQAQSLRDGIADVREAIRFAGTASPNPNYYLPYLAGMTRLSVVEGRRDHAETAVQVADQVLGAPRPNAPLRLTAEHRANLLYQRGNAQLFLENFERAIADFQATLEQERQHLGALVGLAEANASAGRTEPALEAYTRAVRAFPDNPLVYNNRGMYLQRLGRHDEAIDDFTRALQLNSSYVFAYTNRGFTLLESGNPQAAEADFTQSLRVDPNQPTVYSLRGTARVAQGKLRDALADQRKVVELDPNSAMARADLGFTLFFMGDHSQALAALERAVALDPQMRYLDPWRFLTLEHLGRTDDARNLFAESLNKASAARDWNDQLLSFQAGAQNADDLLKAANVADSAARNAQLCEAHFFIGQQHALAGDEQAAADHFRQSVDTGARHLSAYRGAEYALKRFTAAEGPRVAPLPLR